MKQPLLCTECGDVILQLQQSCWGTTYFMNKVNESIHLCTIPAKSLAYVAISFITPPDSSTELNWDEPFNVLL